MLKRLLIAVAVLLVTALAVLGFSLWEARRDPVLREAALAMPDWPAGAPPLKVVLIGDIHVGSSAMNARRLNRIVARINALSPDLVVIAGDFIYGHVPGSAARLGEDMVAPLARLKARLGVVAALGNHDYWTGEAAVRAQLARAGVTVVKNGAVRRGPLTLGVAGDDFSHQDDLPATLAAMRSLAGARVMLTHSPDIAPLLPVDVTLLLAAHTHCGQVVLPLIGPPVSVSRHGNRYRCGLVLDGARRVVVTAGLGTSGPPVRFGAPPDIWLLRLGPR